MGTIQSTDASTKTSPESSEAPTLSPRSSCSGNILHVSMLMMCIGTDGLRIRRNTGRLHLCALEQDHRPRHEPDKQITISTKFLPQKSTLCADWNRESNTLSSVRSMRFSRHTPQKYSKRQICTSQSNHASCVPVHFVKSESEMSTLAVQMTDSEVVAQY